MRNHLTTILVALALAGVVLACGSSEETEAPAAAATAPSTVPEAPAAPEAPTAPEAPAEAAADPATAAGGMQQAGQALAGAMAAAAQAEGDTHCEQAYNSITAMVQAMQKQMGAGNGANLPPQADFLEACNSLPENVQQCMVMSYAMAHQQECQEAQNSIDDETRQRIQRLMGRGGN